MSERTDDASAASGGDEATRRRHRRWFVNFDTTVTLGGEAIACAVRDLSPGGANVELKRQATVFAGHRLTLELPGHGSVRAQVQHNDQGRLGLMFQHDPDGEVAMAGYLAAVQQGGRPGQGAPRLSVTLRASGVDMSGVMDEISRFGGRVSMEETRHIMPGQEVTLEVPSFGRILAVAQRVEDRELSLAFMEELDVVTGAFADSGGRG